MAGKFEEETRKLIALKFLTSSTSSFGDRAQRRFEKTRDEIGGRLKKKLKGLPKDSDLVLKLSWDDKEIAAARKINLAIEEFKQKYPDYGEKLQELIDVHRSGRRAYLEFGGEVSNEVYIGVVQEIMGRENVDYESARKIYGSIEYIGEILGKKEKTLQKSMLSE